MPTYDYVCKACGHRLEIYQSITESPKRKCPACKKSKLERQLGSGAAILFKGSGFYQTDYRSDSYRAGEKAEKSDSKPAPAADTTTPETKAPESKAKDSTEAKPAAKSKDAKKKH